MTRTAFEAARRRAWIAGLFFAGTAFGCANPNIDEYEPRSGIITGTIFYPSAKARGNVIVLLFREDTLPPPAGTGRPVNFVVVPERALFKDAAPDAVADFASPFTMPTVSAGRYQIRAFLDATASFNPTVDLLSQPTAGDVGGGYIDRDTRKFLPIVVENDKATSQITVTLGITYPVERPAFAFSSTTTFAVPFTTPQKLILTSHPIQRPPIKMDPSRTAFLIQFLDDDGRFPIDPDGDHLPDLYPRVIFRRTTPPPDESGTIIIPGIIDPLPYLDELMMRGSAITTRLEVLIPPVAIQRTAMGDTFLPEVPAGKYETVLISGTGQTWTVPNNLDRVQPIGGPDPTQSALVTMAQGPPLPAGRINGRVRIPNDHRADAYVFAFDASNPPPPAGTGRPVALATLRAASFLEAGGGALDAPFLLSGLRDGTYIVRGLLDVTGDFSPISDLLAQPPKGDFGGSSNPAAVRVTAGSPATGIQVDLLTPILFDRPAFEFDPIEISRTALPKTIELRTHAIPFLKMTQETLRIPVTLACPVPDPFCPADEDGDNLRDLYPRVLLSLMSGDTGDPRTAPDDPERIAIPGIVDPIPFLTALSGGAPAVPATSLRVILPPAAVKVAADGTRQILSPPPPGRYRVNVLSATGQTWSVPSPLDAILRRIGTPREDSTQARFVRILSAPLPGGSISGRIQLGSAPPSGELEVVVLAFASANLPPPRGAGRPAASAIVPKSAFAAGSAPYTLRGLATGSYSVLAFLDANHDFTPWFDTMNQPDAGDVGGGSLELPSGRLRTIEVDALGQPVTNVEVLIPSNGTYPNDRPVFALNAPGIVLDPSMGMLVVSLSALAIDTSLIRQHGVFPAQWVDHARYPAVQAEIFPLVVAELLDSNDPTNLTVSSAGIRIPGIVSPAQFAPLGLPMMNDQGQAVINTDRMVVAFPPFAVDPSGQRISPPPTGRYRITVITERGQTWSVPNELERAVGTELVASQAGVLVVR